MGGIPSLGYSGSTIAAWTMLEELLAGGHDVTAVRLRGQILDPAPEFFTADVLLAPNPTTTGASARIVSGLTFASCIVAHTDSLIGIPELEHGTNCLLGRDGRELADATIEALRD